MKLFEAGSSSYWKEGEKSKYGTSKATNSFIESFQTRSYSSVAKIESLP